MKTYNIEIYNIEMIEWFLTRALKIADACKHMHVNKTF
jgi:hypothetical protein